MKLNTKTRYAVMALAEMAKFPQKKPISLRDVSLRQSISLFYLEQIFLALDERVKTIGCKKDSKKGCNGKLTKCITHYLWEELETHINIFFESKKLSDLIKPDESRIV